MAGGVEYGTYTYNSATGLLQISNTVDENGCVGLSEDGTSSSLVISVTENQLIFSDRTLDRVQ